VNDIDRFLDETAQELRTRVALLTGGERRALEDSVALLTDYRLAGMDDARFETLLATLRAGRSPVGLLVLRPQELGEELARRWRAARTADSRQQATEDARRGQLGVAAGA
jgi:hypothetical protein